MNTNEPKTMPIPMNVTYSLHIFMYCNVKIMFIMGTCDKWLILMLGGFKLEIN
jgi:hypothetical protein